MYAKNNNYVNYFVEDGAKHTDKVFYGRVSETIKAPDGTKTYESWNARFVGKAREKALNLADKTNIMLTEWNARCPYDKEKKKVFPYIMVMDFEISTPNEN